MRQRQKSFVTIVLAAAAAILCTGCPALMIPGLAYSGYQYTHKKDQPAASSTSSTESATAQSKKTKTAQTAKSTTPPPQKIPDSDIE